MNVFDRWPNLAAMMLGLGAERGSRPLLRHWHDGDWATLSWQEFAEQAARLAYTLGAALPPKARVLLVSEARPEVPIANVALQAAGLVPVPAYTTNTVADHAHLLRDSGARAAIVSSEAHAARVLQAAGGALDLLICMDGCESAGFAPGGCTVARWEQMLAGPSRLDEMREAAARITPTSVAVLMYTSGTGGAPKGVMVPHRAILSNCRGAALVVRPLNLTNETYLSILPLSHAYEYTVGQYFLAAIGCEVVFARGVDTLAADLQVIRPHIITVVPRVLEVVRSRVLSEVARMPQWRRHLFGRALRGGLRRIDGIGSFGDRLLAPLLDRLVAQRIRARFGGRMLAIVSGGARLDPEVGRFFAAMGLRLMQGYGQTEAGPVISVNPPDAVRVQTVGPPLEGVELRIAPDGEILVRGDLVMLGYWGQPEDTAQAVEDGWLHTGDVGHLDDAGYLVITDRKKDIIVLSGGENVSPARIEGLLMNEAAIFQAVVTGDGQAGLRAVIVPAEGAAPDAVHQAVARVNAGLAGGERVRRHTLAEPFTLANGLLTPTQKIRRRRVIEHSD